MDQPTKRNDDYRYTVELASADITPLASVEAFIGDRGARVLNISQGGMAIVTSEEPPFQVGDLVDASVSLHERPFPVRVQIKAKMRVGDSHRMSCQFLDPHRQFQGALRTFLQPKYLGMSLRRNLELSGRADVIGLVDGAQLYEAFVGANETGVFVWAMNDRTLLKIVAVSRDLLMEWTQEAGLKTARMHGRDDRDIAWDRNPEMPVIHYFADLLIAWLGNAEGVAFIEALTLDDSGAAPSGPQLKVPDLK